MRLLLVALLLTSPLDALSKVDAYIVCEDKEQSVLEDTIIQIKRYVECLNNVYVVSKKKLSDNALWIPYANFPFDKKKIERELKLSKSEKKKRKTFVAALYKDLLAYYAPMLNASSEDIVYITKAGYRLKQKLFAIGRGEVLYNDFVVGDFDQQQKAPYLHELIENWYISVRNVFPVANHRIMSKTLATQIASNIESSFGTPFWSAICQVAYKYDADTTLFAPTQILYFFYILDKKREVTSQRFIHLNSYYDIKKVKRKKRKPKKKNSLSLS